MQLSPIYAILSFEPDFHEDGFFFVNFVNFQGLISMKIGLIDEKGIYESQTLWLSGCTYQTKAKNAKKIDI